MKYISKPFFAILNFLNLLDRSNNISISNVAVIIVVTKIAFTPALGIAEAGALLLTLLNYSHKRYESNKLVKQESKSELDGVKEAIEKVVEVQNSITKDMTKIFSTFESVEKTAEDAKTLLSRSNLASAFTPRSKRNTSGS